MMSTNSGHMSKKRKNNQSKLHNTVKEDFKYMLCTRNRACACVQLWMYTCILVSTSVQECKCVSECLKVFECVHVNVCENMCWWEGGRVHVCQLKTLQSNWLHRSLSSKTCLPEHSGSFLEVVSDIMYAGKCHGIFFLSLSRQAASSTSTHLWSCDYVFHFIWVTFFI